MLISFQLDLLSALLAPPLLPGSQVSWEVSILVFYVVQGFRRPSGVTPHQSKTSCIFKVRWEHVQPSCECLQWWRLHNFCGQPGPVFDQPAWEFFPAICNVIAVTLPQFNIYTRLFAIRLLSHLQVQGNDEWLPLPGSLICLTSLLLPLYLCGTTFKLD